MGRKSCQCHPFARTAGLVAVLCSIFWAAPALGQTTAITFQGQLTDPTTGRPANEFFDFQLKLFDSATGIGQVGSTFNVNFVSVRNGFFTITPDFGTSPFTGARRWLQVEVKKTSPPTKTYTVLVPRVELTSVPYAILAKGAPWGGLTGVPAGFADGTDNDTTYAAGAGLSLTGTTFSIANAGVVNAMLAPNAVTSDKIADGAVGSTDLANAAVTPGKVNSAGAAEGNALTFNGVGVVWGAPRGALPLPFSETVNIPAAAMRIVNESDNPAASAIFGEMSSSTEDTDSAAIIGSHLGTGKGVWGSCKSGVGVFGEGDRGVFGLSPRAGASGVFGENTSAGFGVQGHHSSTGNLGYLGGPDWGVHGVSSSGTGVSGLSFARHGLRGEGRGAGVNGAAIRADNTNPHGIGLWATNNSDDATVVIGNGGTGDLIRGFGPSQPCCPLFRVQNDGRTIVPTLEITGGVSLKEQRHLDAWGSEPYGLSGIPGDLLAYEDPVNTPFLKHAIAIAAGPDYNVAVTRGPGSTDSGVSIWGNLDGLADSCPTYGTPNVVGVAAGGVRDRASRPHHHDSQRRDPSRVWLQHLRAD